MSVDFRTLVVGPLETNCYVIWDTTTLEFPRQAAVIDPGGGMADISEIISAFDLKVKHVLLTHGHPDHCFLAGRAERDLSAEISMHEYDIEQIGEGLVIAEMFYDVSTFVPFTPSRLLNDGDVLQLGRSSIEVIHTPGHSQGGLCFATEAGIFCGDTIFAGSIGRTDFPGGDFEQLISSIRTKLFVMKDGTPLYPGHGPATSVGRERATNPFLT